MALMNLSSGHPNRNAGFERPLQNMNQSADGPDRFKNSDRSPPSASGGPSIQNMLRADTELGLSEHFIPKHQYRPPSKLRLEGTDRVPSYSGINVPHFPPPLPHDQENHPMRDESKHGYSALSPRRLAYLAQRDVETVAEYRSCFVTQKSCINPTLDLHPHQIVNYRSRGFGPNGRPRSPFAYPTRLKRPGSRPSSPAWSDVNQAGYSSRSSSRPASPISTQTTTSLSAFWRQQANHSDPMLSHYPPYLAQRDSPYLPVGTDGSQGKTSQPTSSLRSITGLSHSPRTHRSNLGLPNQKRSPPVSPLFYDYSEAFEETHQTSTSSLAILHEDDDPKSDIEASNSVQAQNFETIDVSAERFDPPSPEPKVINHQVIPRVRPLRKASSLPVTSNQHPLDDSNKDRKRYTISTTVASVIAESVCEGNTDGTPRPPRAPIFRNGADTTQHKVTTNPMSNVPVQCTSVEAPTTRDYADSIASSTESMCTAESGFGPERALANTKTDTPSSLPKVQTTTLGLQSQRSEDAGSLRTIKYLAAKAEEYSLSEPTEIISPTPERSILSSSNQHRFSKILGVDEPSFIKRSLCLNADDPPQYSKNPTDNDAAGEGEKVVDERTLNNSLPENSESDEEPQLSPSFMQTFGQIAKPSTYKLAAMDESTGESNIHESSKSATIQTMLTDPIPMQLNSSKDEEAVNIVAKNEASVASSHAAAGKRNRQTQVLYPPFSGSTLGVETKLPPVLEDQRAIIAILPPSINESSSLPFAFMPLSSDLSEEATASKIEISVADTDALGINSPQADLELPVSSESGNATDRESTASSRGSRPWNRDSNYPWHDKSLDLDVLLPKEDRTPSPVGRFPRFKLRIHRASTSSAGTGVNTKFRSSSDGAMSSRRSSNHFLSQTTILKLRSKHRIPARPGQENSSHAMGKETMRSRFAESFDAPPQIDTVFTSPTITLMPPSPGHDVRSFFSDDSSQVRQKGSLRKRLSNLKARHAQATSTDDVRASDRGLLNTTFGRARPNGRTSRQSHATAGATSQKSHLSRVRARMFRTVRFWWQRGEDRVRDLKWKLRRRNHRPPVELYPGT